MDNKVTNYLLAHEGMSIIQRKDMFNFSLDSVLLANFATISKNTKTIIDFGTNNAVIPLLLSRRYDKKIIALEIQAEAVEIARENVTLNNLDNQISIIHADIKDFVEENKKNKVNLVVCNPPFFKVGEKSNLNENEYLQIARHEIKISLEEIIASASKILENKGRFALVHRPDRFIEIVETMKKYDIEPKRVRFVYPKENRDSHILLIEGIYKGSTGLIIEPPLYAHNEDGSYSNEVKTMFGEDINE